MTDCDVTQGVSSATCLPAKLAPPRTECRRQMGLEIGPGIGRLSDGFARGLEDISPGSREFTKFGTDRILGDVIGELIHLCQWRLKD